MNLPRLLSLLASSILLSACGGGDGAAPQPQSLLTPESAWTGERPAGAEDMEPAAFEAALRAGELSLITPDSQAQTHARRVAAVQADLAYLQGQGERSVQLNELLTRAAAAGDLHAEPVLELGGQTLRLLSLYQELSAAAAADRAARDPRALLARYAARHSLLTQEQRASLPSPESLDGASAEALRAALLQFDAALEALPYADGTVALLEAVDSGAIVKAAPVGGNGSDTAVCARSTTGLHANFYWPLRNFVTPVRDQGRRGTCWAFAAVAAIESRERVQTQQTRNLSEQFLVNQVKTMWNATDFEDGYSGAGALADLLDHGQSLPPESYWRYNPSFSRVGGDGPIAYSGACDGYDGSCSPTAHQSPLRCSDSGNTFCGYQNISFDGPGTGASRTIQIWAGGPLPLTEIRNQLANGTTLMATFGVRVGFSRPENGFVTDFRDGYFDNGGAFRAGSKGGHEVLIVGYIDATAVQAAIHERRVDLPGVDPEVGGRGIFSGPGVVGGFPVGVNGYFILKNSWGCAGDGGFVYVPDNYVQQYFTRISALAFGPARASQWQQQNYLRLEPGKARVDLRVPTRLFSAAPPPGGSLSALAVQAASSNPADRFDSVSSFGVGLYSATFHSVGRRTIEVSVSYAGVPAVQTERFDVEVVNTPPQFRFANLPNSAVRVAETITLSAVITDPNEVSASALCRSLRWQVFGADITLDGNGSCSQRVRFAEEGQRTVRVSVTDSDGAIGIRDLNFPVIEAAANPYPRITRAGLSTAGVGRGQSCRLPETVAADGLIDLRFQATSNNCGGQPNTANYYGSAEVENPSAEPLRYFWTLWVDTPDTNLQNREAAVFDVLGAPYGAGGNFPCGITLTVFPPADGQRTKSQPVWQGTCVLPAVVPR